MSIEQIRQTAAEVLDMNNPVNWVILSSDGDKVNLLGKGTGLESFRAAFKDELVQYGLFNVLTIFEDNIAVSRRPNLVQINWIGRKVSAMQKAKALRPSDFGAAQYFQQVKVRLDCFNGSREAETVINANTFAWEIKKSAGAWLNNNDNIANWCFDFGDSKLKMSDVRDSQLNNIPVN